jgi:hypothetical protein
MILPGGQTATSGRVSVLQGEAHAYLDRRTAEGKTRREAIRCLKRYLAREIYTLLQPPTTATTHPATA